MMTGRWTPLVARSQKNWRMIQLSLMARGHDALNYRKFGCFSKGLDLNRELQSESRGIVHFVGKIVMSDCSFHV